MVQLGRGIANRNFSLSLNLKFLDRDAARE